VVQIAPRSTYKKSGCWITNWQFYWSRSYVRLSLKVRSLHETYTWGYTWRPLACYPFINIKWASYHLLLYLVYLCQKSWNFIHAFICYKQKCKVVSLNLAHPVELNLLPARRYTIARVIAIVTCLPVCLSVCPHTEHVWSVCHESLYCVKTKKASVMMISSPSGSPMILAAYCSHMVNYVYWI